MELLQSQSLHLGPREPTNNPALMLLLALINLILDKVNDDVIVDYTPS